MPKTKTLPIETLISQLRLHKISDQLKAYKELATMISEAEQEAKKSIEEQTATLELIRGGGK